MDTRERRERKKEGVPQKPWSENVVRPWSVWKKKRKINDTTTRKRKIR